MSQTEELSRREEQFLENVLENLRQRIGKIAQELEEGQKDIESMHEYYWENYTEMDQYGYEDYDNQQALLHRINANQEKLDLKHRFQKMLDSPFFGRVDFIYEGEEEAEPFYIGIGNFAQRTGATPLIYDWRAPVSSLFYDYDSGPASYEAPAGVLTGEIASKWQYKIKNGKMIYAFESDTKIDDEILKQELGSSGDVQLKNIVRTIQKEQNEIIRNTGDKILVIQGAAGSGKTSVALHRIAYLLYHDREHLKSSNILILSPNSVFSDYISHILPELGEENIREMSFDLFAYKELKDVVSDCEDRYHHMERQMKFPDKKRQKRFRDKQSFAMTGQMESFLAVLELLDRHGKAVEEVHFSEEESMLKAIGENLNVGENGYETAAVIAMTEEKARELYELLKRRGIQASYIDRDTSVFERGLTVTTFYLAKGLEFDQVFGVFEEEENPLMTQAKYICATRALHELYMYTVSL